MTGATRNNNNNNNKRLNHSKQTTTAGTVHFVNTAKCRTVELNLKRTENQNLGDIAQGMLRFSSSLQPLPPERGNKSSVFAHSWDNDWARGQTSITDENKRLSGVPLKENCWGETDTLMACRCGSNRSECVCVDLQEYTVKEVLVYFKWSECVNISRSKYIFQKHPGLTVTQTSEVPRSVKERKTAATVLFSLHFISLLSPHILCSLSSLCSLFPQNECALWRSCAENVVWLNSCVST